MAIRSVAEILPRSFEELDLDDVAKIVELVGEQRESVFFEKKAAVRRDTLAKACSAFANTMGGLLVVGIPNDSNDLVGIEDDVSEAQLWVKDRLRGSVIPLPPFRARRIDVEDGRWLLLVLVEESSTTPHFTYQGAIYVRNPSSSDPMPVAEQRTLFELIERGRAAELRAAERGFGLVGTRPERVALYQTLVMAPTGITGDALRRAELLDPGVDRRLAGVLDLGERPPITEQWRQEFVSVRAELHGGVLRSGAVQQAKVLQATLYRHGAIVVHEGISEQERPEAAELDQVRAWLLETLTRGRDLLLDLGAHGDLRLAYRLTGGARTLMYGQGRGEPVSKDVTVGVWARLDPDELADTAVLNELTAELLRALGIRPANRSPH